MTDRPCARCGYNLKGLETGGRCPECGTPITVKRKSVRFADSLVDAPMWYVKLVALAMGLMAVVVVGVIVVWLAHWVGLVSAGFGSLGFTMLAGVWFAAAWLVTIERPRTERTLKDEILDHAKLRPVCRWSQAAGLAAVGLVWAYVLTGFGVFSLLAGIVSLGVLAGLVPMGVYLSALADWSGDTGVGGRLRAAVWCIAVCGTLLMLTLLLVIARTPLGLILRIALPLFTIIVMGGIALFGVSVVQLSMSALWAIQNSHEAREREIRMAEKRQRRAERDAIKADAATAAIAEAAAARDAEMDESIPESIPLSDDETAPAAREVRHHSTKQAVRPTMNPDEGGASDDADPYDLAPDDERA